MKLAFYIVATICFLLAALPLSEPYSGKMLPIGLMFFAMAHYLPFDK